MKYIYPKWPWPINNLETKIWRQKQKLHINKRMKSGIIWQYMEILCGDNPIIVDCHLELLLYLSGPWTMFLKKCFITPETLLNKKQHKNNLIYKIARFICIWIQLSISIFFNPWLYAYHKEHEGKRNSKIQWKL